MKRKTIICVSVLISVGQGTSNSNPFENLAVGIWPEYDHAGVLVIYSGTVKDARLPLHLEIGIPGEAQLVLGIGQSDTSERLLPLDIEEREDGQWVSMDIIKKQFQIEFYYDPFTTSEERVINFPIKTNWNMKDFRIVVQRPLAAEQFVFAEPGAETFNDEHGMTYHMVHVPELRSREEKVVSVTYRNPSGKTSMFVLQGMFSGSSSGGNGAESEVRQSVPRYRLPTYELLAVLGLVSLIIGYIFWRSNRKRHEAPSPARGKNFCPNCGFKIGKTNIFCVNCGKKVR